MNEANTVFISQELLSKIDQCRGALSREGFLHHCINTFPEREADTAGKEKFVTRADFEEFEYNMKELQRSFIEFMIVSGLELRT